MTRPALDTARRPDGPAPRDTFWLAGPLAVAASLAALVFMVGAVAALPQARGDDARLSTPPAVVPSALARGLARVASAVPGSGSDRTLGQVVARRSAASRALALRF